MTLVDMHIKSLSHLFPSPGIRQIVPAYSADFLHMLGCVFGAFSFQAALEMLILT